MIVADYLHQINNKDLNFVELEKKVNDTEVPTAYLDIVAKALNITILFLEEKTMVIIFTHFLRM